MIADIKKMHIDIVVGRTDRLARWAFSFLKLYTSAARSRAIFLLDFVEWPDSGLPETLRAPCTIAGIKGALTHAQ
jgi:hypothetical protein